MASSTKRRPRSLADQLLAAGGQGDISADEQAAAAETSFTPVPRALLIPIERLAPNPDNPRKTFEHLDDLAESIAERGLLQPLVVRRDPARPGFYVTIAGARRLLASRVVQGHNDSASRARVSSLPCVVMDETERDAFADALAENLARQDLSRMEVMTALSRLHRDYNWSARYIARRTGRSVGDVAELLGIAHDETVAPLVRDELITATTAGQIRRLPAQLRPAAIEGVQSGRVKTVEDVRRLRRDAEAGRATQLGVTANPTTSSAQQVSDIGHPGKTTTAPENGKPASNGETGGQMSSNDPDLVNLEALAVIHLFRARGTYVSRVEVVQALRADLALLDA
ncbi:MAG: chromosome partitioning protein ParB [Chloroflexi bacterium]|jgi:ParB family chromosome partitioning protein|nr:chromosome partitioning protein ParB [Chloroflexota bacterium]